MTRAPPSAWMMDMAWSSGLKHRVGDTGVGGGRALLVCLSLLAGCPSTQPTREPPPPAPVLAPDVQAWARCVDHINHCRTPHGFWLGWVLGTSTRPGLECAREARTCSTPEAWKKVDGDCCPAACIDEVLRTGDADAMFVADASKHACFRTVLSPAPTAR